jgi:hypothetical protein
MGLPWVRLDTQWPHNPKFLMLAEDKKWRAICVYMAGLAYCGAQGTDGFIPYYAISVVQGTKKEAIELVAVSLWHPCEGGWQINDWSDYQYTTEENQKRSDKARQAALTRWHGKQPAHGNASGMLRAVPEPSPSNARREEETRERTYGDGATTR